MPLLKIYKIQKIAENDPVIFCVCENSAPLLCFFHRAPTSLLTRCGRVRLEAHLHVIVSSSATGQVLK